MKRFEVTWKRRLNHNMVWLKIYAPLVAKHAKPGQFIILRTDEFGERIPLTMAGHNEEDGTIDLIYAAVGRTTMLMNQLEVCARVSAGLRYAQAWRGNCDDRRFQNQRSGHFGR